jgi:hypothetical protein
VDARAAKAKTRSAGDPIQLAMSFVATSPAAEAEGRRVPFVASDDDLPAIFFAEVEATKEANAPAGGSENLSAAEAVTG